MFRNLFRSRSKPTPTSSLAFRPAVEGLEERRLMSAGALDLNFGQGGKVVVAFDKGGAKFDSGSAVVVDSLGRTIVAGTAPFSGQNGNDHDFAVIRLNTHGSLDKTFRFGGMRALPLALGGRHAAPATHLALPP